MVGTMTTPGLWVGQCLFGLTFDTEQVLSLRIVGKLGMMQQKV